MSEVIALKIEIAELKMMVFKLQYQIIESELHELKKSGDSKEVKSEHA